MSTELEEDFKLSLEYIEEKDYFKDIITELMGFKKESYREGQSRYFPFDLKMVYTLTYDYSMTLENWSEIVKRVKNKRIYKKSKELQEHLSGLQENYLDYPDYNTFYTHMNKIRNLGFKTGDCPSEFNHVILNDFRTDINHQKHWWGKCANPIFVFTEHNGWEREVWHVWFDKQSDVIMEKLNELNTELMKLSVKQLGGNTRFYMTFVEHDKSDLDSKNKDNTSYFRNNKFIEGNIIESKLDEVLKHKFDTDYLFKYFYKQGVGDLFIA